MDWMCLPRSLSILIQRPMDEILSKIGHDGSEIIWPEFGPIQGRRGFHIQEIINTAYKYGYALTPFDAEIYSYSQDIAKLTKFSDFVPIYFEVMQRHTGIITGETVTGSPHALAWKNKTVHDPDNIILTLDGFKIYSFYMLRKIEILPWE